MIRFVVQWKWWRRRWVIWDSEWRRHWHGPFGIGGIWTTSDRTRADEVCGSLNWIASKVTS